MSRPDAFQSLASTLRGLAPLGDPALAALRGITETRSFAAHEFLLRAGDTARLCYWIERGLIRELYIAEDGAEHIRRFVAEDGLTGSLLDLLSGKPAVTFVQALEPTEVLCWDYARFDELCAELPDLQLAARRFTERLYIWNARHEHDLLAMSARERLTQWLTAQPNLDARVSRRHLASYLGITPEHLSRLRRA